MSENKRGKLAAFNLSERYSSEEIQKRNVSASVETVKNGSEQSASAPFEAAPPATPAPEVPLAAEGPVVPAPEVQPEKEPAALPSSAAAPKAARSGGGRKAKASASAAKKKLTDKKSYEKTVTVYMSEEEHTRYKVDCILSKKPLSDFFLDATRAYHRNTFVCNAPDCGTEFTIQFDSEGEVKTPACCPCCGGNRISTLKF